ncbi:TonB-dependent receptor [Rhodanobacter sp. PCA2]|uniref:TonB-dependent receptor n=1 Tax=Rhodanobacter sp. PCA2 TaxID=2006117 RepID=UPI0015E6487E|nr:TonB-dependent receptor [Rhodanobacter sp. PCA2]MBA2078010.1 Oar protein [Rhodanobacter sp. PCA2]
MIQQSQKHIARNVPVRTLLTVAMLAALHVGSANAQSTTGSLTGAVPEEVTSVVIRNDSGYSREIKVEGGRYQVSQLPLGIYSVTAKKGEAVYEVRDRVPLTVGTSTEISFLGNVKTFSAVQVSADPLANAIDVSSVDSRTVVTADQIAKLPMEMTSEAIAQLAPSVVNNSGGFKSPTGQSLVSFGGSSVSENAYYINGLNTTDPYNNLGGLTLPTVAISQQEVFTGGYSAKYGRSSGGVLSAVGKRGTKEWKFGVQYAWEPGSMRGDYRNVRYPANGGMFQPRSKDKLDANVASAYFGGPLISDRLYLFGAYELRKESGVTVNNVESSNSYVSFYDRQPRWYGKLDWYVSDNHIVELTAASSRLKTYGNIYNYDYESLDRENFTAQDDVIKRGGDIWSAQYTGYLTNNLTLSALYGKQDTQNYDGIPGYNPNLTYVQGHTFQNPLLTGGSPIRNAQTVSSVFNPGRGGNMENLRIDLNYQAGTHGITVGVDNQKAEAVKQGRMTSGPGYYWIYGKTDPNVPISSGLGVPATSGFPNGAGGYYVRKYVFNQLANIRSEQTAQYVEDNWQVNNSLLLNLGLRLDQFTNYNSAGQSYIKQSSGQWAPRLGFSWDVLSDSTFKVFGNAGRYYLALPLGPALTAAGALEITSTYYTYGGINPDGTPAGLSQMSGAVSPNGYYGILPDARTVTSQGMKPSYQDEFILGFTKAWDSAWVYGAKATFRSLRTGVDDYCGFDRVVAKAASLGYTVTGESNPLHCWLMNPGLANTFKLIDTSGNLVTVPMNAAEIGLPEYKRKYYGLNFLLEHPFDGKWYARLDYTFSRSYGTAEGQVISVTQQAATSTTSNWDYPEVMEHSNGPQANDHTHQIKLYGYYQFSPEWLASWNISAVSGAPKVCLGSYGANQADPNGFHNEYRYCFGEPSPPGKYGRLPWVKQLDLAVTYRPDFAGGKLAFNASMFNVLNARAVTWRHPYSEIDPGTPDPLYGAGVNQQAPRYVRLSMSYDY